MIGNLFGIAIFIGYLGEAWSGKSTGDNFFNGGLATGLGFILGAAILGLVLFPRTVGFAFTPASFLTPICFLIGWVRHGLGFGFQMLAFGIAMWLTTFVIGHIRRASTL